MTESLFRFFFIQIKYDHPTTKTRDHKNNVMYLHLQAIKAVCLEFLFVSTDVTPGLSRLSIYPTAFDCQVAHLRDRDRALKKTARYL
jgi:hypothetical protein